MSTEITIEQFNADFEPKIKESLSATLSQYPNRDTLLKYASGGKNLRGKLALLSYFTCGGVDEAKGLKVAAASELFQSASLIKDDILDKDQMRRGQPSAWVQEGPMGAMKTADTTIIAGLDALVDSGKDLVKTALGAWSKAWQGEAKEFSVIKGLENIEGPAYRFYLNVIKQKTASLFEMATKMGAQAALASDELIIVMANYGTNLGIAYQLTDDYVDMQIAKLRSIPKVGVVAAAQFEENIKQGIAEAATKGKFNVGQILMEMNINAGDFYKSNIGKFQIQAEMYAASPHIPPNQYTALLKQFPGYCVKQMLTEGKVEL
jgi:hypothetical protein